MSSKNAFAYWRTNADASDGSHISERYNCKLNNPLKKGNGFLVGRDEEGH